MEAKFVESIEVGTFAELDATAVAESRTKGNGDTPALTRPATAPPASRRKPAAARIGVRRKLRVLAGRPTGRAAGATTIWSAARVLASARFARGEMRRLGGRRRLVPQCGESVSREVRHESSQAGTWCSQVHRRDGPARRAASRAP